MDKPVLIVGAGGHARVIADILACQGRVVLGALDDAPSHAASSLPVLGKVDDYPRFCKDASFILGIGSNLVRETLAGRMEGQVQFTTAVHPSAILAKDVRLAAGTVVMAGAVINTGSTIGRHCIINTAASIDHDCRLDDFVHISPGAHLAGSVHLGKRCWIGLGGLVINNKVLCDDVMLGAGAVAVADIGLPGVYLGLPARLVRKAL